MTANTKIDFQLRNIARVRLEDSPEVFEALVTVFESDTKQGAALRDEFSKLKARRAASVLGMLDLPEDIIKFVDAWKIVYSHLNESGVELRTGPPPAGLKNPVDDLSIYPLEELSALSGRTETEILDDVQLGVLRASLLTHAVDAEDHTKRQVLKAGYDDGPFTVIRPRVVWISHLQAGELRRQGEVTLSEAEYPIFIDCLPSPPIKRYKKERAIFSGPYTAKLSDLRFLDGDAIHYIAKHTGQELAGPDAVGLLAKPEAGGSYVVYTLFSDGPGVEPEKPEAAESQSPSPASGAKRKGAFQAQDEEMEAALRALGYDPLDIPPHVPGQKGISGEVREYLKDNPLFTQSSFGHAWKRARARVREVKQNKG